MRRRCYSLTRLTGPHSVFLRLLTNRCPWTPVWSRMSPYCFSFPGKRQRAARERGVSEWLDTVDSPRTPTTGVPHLVTHGAKGIVLELQNPHLRNTHTRSAAYYRVLVHTWLLAHGSTKYPVSHISYACRFPYLHCCASKGWWCLSVYLVVSRSWNKLLNRSRWTFATMELTFPAHTILTLYIYCSICCTVLIW